MATETVPRPGKKSAGSAPGPLHRTAGRLTALPIGVLLAYLVLVPLAMLLISSVKPTGMPLDDGWTLAHYRDVYGDPNTVSLASNSTVFALGGALIAMVFGVGLAWLTERTDLPGRTALRFLVIVPMAMPPVLLAIAWVLLLSPRIGALNQFGEKALGLPGPFFDIYSMPGMILVQGLSLVPTTYLIVSPAVRNLDPAMEEAAMASGYGPLKVIRKISLPLLRPSLLAAGAFITILGFVVFDVPGVLGLPKDVYVLSSEIYYRAQPPSGLPDYGGISALAVSFLLLLFALSWFYHRQIARSQRFVTISGKAARARRMPLGRWKAPAMVFAWGYLVLAAVLPFLTLLLTSLMPYYSGVTSDTFGRLTLANHRALLDDGGLLRAALNSGLVAVIAATVVVLLSAVVSWYAIRSKGPLRRTFDVVAFLPLAIPSMMIGVALIYVYLTLNRLPVYGTIAILIIAYATMYLSFGTRTTNGVLLQISKELEEAAQASGANWLSVFRAVTMPMMRPALVAVWMWVAAHALRELSAALMLQGTDNDVVPTVLWGYWESGHPTVAAAMGVWLIIAVFAVVCVWGAMTGRRKGDFR